MATILLALDKSKHSEFCLEYYLNFIHKPDNKVYAVFVAEYFGDLRVMEGPTPGRVHELEEQDNQTAHTVSDMVAKAFSERGVNYEFKKLLDKEPWHAITTFAKNINATLIVLGSRGMGKLRRTVMGSVSDSVLHHSDVAVLVCKHPSDKHHHQQQHH